MTAKTLLTITAVLETSTGLGLAVAPSALSKLLLGPPLESPASLIMARILAAALVAIGATCWFAREEVRPRAVVIGLTFYNGAVVLVLAYAIIGQNLSTIATVWVMILHAALSNYGVACLRKLPPLTSDRS